MKHLLLTLALCAPLARLLHELGHPQAPPSQAATWDELDCPSARLNDDRAHPTPHPDMERERAYWIDQIGLREPHVLPGL